MNTLISTVHTVAGHVTATASHIVPAKGQGIIDVLTDVNSQAQALVTGIAITVAIILVIVISAKARFAPAAILGACVGGAFLWFAVNGGLETIGNFFTSQFS